METNFPVDNADEHMKFKSYYVVWKRASKNTETSKKLSFKSYYVVWKLLFPRNIYTYVVCLNRTM